jgi:hypothetical protein
VPATAAQLNIPGLRWTRRGISTSRIPQEPHPEGDAGGDHHDTVAGNGTSQVYSGDGGPATAAQLWRPSGRCGGRGGQSLHRGYLEQPHPEGDAGGDYHTVAGTGTYGYSGDGGPATAAQLASPTGVAVDAAGNLYIADTNNHRIRKVTPTGTSPPWRATGTWLQRGRRLCHGGAAQLPERRCGGRGGQSVHRGSWQPPHPEGDACGIITTMAGTGTLGLQRGRRAGDGGAAHILRRCGGHGGQSLHRGY